eukprot:sb/3470701/
MKPHLKFLVFLVEYSTRCFQSSNTGPPIPIEVELFCQFQSFMMIGLKEEGKYSTSHTLIDSQATCQANALTTVLALRESGQANALTTSDCVQLRIDIGLSRSVVLVSKLPKGIVFAVAETLLKCCLVILSIPKFHDDWIEGRGEGQLLWQRDRQTERLREGLREIAANLAPPHLVDDLSGQCSDHSSRAPRIGSVRPML